MNIIEIKGVRYQVRLENGVPHILYSGKWLIHDKFIDRLCDDGKMDQVFELAMYGFNIKKQEIASEEKAVRRW